MSYFVQVPPPAPRLVRRYDVEEYDEYPPHVTYMPPALPPPPPPPPPPLLPTYRRTTYQGVSGRSFDPYYYSRYSHPRYSGYGYGDSYRSYYY